MNKYRFIVNNMYIECNATCVKIPILRNYSVIITSHRPTKNNSTPTTLNPLLPPIVFPAGGNHLWFEGGQLARTHLVKSPSGGLITNKDDQAWALSGKLLENGQKNLSAMYLKKKMVFRSKSLIYIYIL